MQYHPQSQSYYKTTTHICKDMNNFYRCCWNVYQYFNYGVSQLLSIAVIRNTDLNKLGKERIYLAQRLWPTTREVQTRTEGRKPDAGIKAILRRNATYWYAQFTFLLYDPGPSFYKQHRLQWTELSQCTLQTNKISTSMTSLTPSSTVK